MNNQQMKINKKIKKPYSLFTYFCLLLAVAVTCMGATFARYVSKPIQGDVNVGVAHLACSFSLEDVSSTVFSNSDYWVPVEGNKMAQNHPREICFSVCNYEKNADGTKSAPSEVDLQSTFRFFAPQELLGKVAFQILKKGDGDSSTPLTQQYVLPTIIEKATKGTVEMSTTDFKMDANGKNITTDYNGETESTEYKGTPEPANYGEIQGRPEETITLSNQGFDKANGTGKIVVETKTESEQVATISISAEKRLNLQYEMAQVRGKEIDVDDGNGGKKKVNNMAAPEYYSIHQTAEMVYYCLDITLPSMIIKAQQNEVGAFQPVDDQFIFAFTVIDHDTLVEPKDTKLAEQFNVKGVSLYSDAECKTLSKTVVVKVVNSLDADSKITSSKYALVEDLAEKEFPLNGNTVVLKEKDKDTTYYIDEITKTYLNNPTWNPFAENPQNEADYLSYKVGDYVKKSFSTDMKVLFTQASQSGGN